MGGTRQRTEDTVELAKGKRKSRLFGRLGKVLVLDDEVADLEDVVRDEALERTGSVSNLERGVVGLVGRRSGRVVLGVKLHDQIHDTISLSASRNRRKEEEGWIGTNEASDAGALGSRDPEVGRSGVHNDLESLGRSSELDLGKVLSVLNELKGEGKGRWSDGKEAGERELNGQRAMDRPCSLREQSRDRLVSVNAHDVEP
jgi:hypothetical protein